MSYTKEKMIDLIEQAVIDAPEGQFVDVEQALKVIASAANYLFSQCEGAHVKDGSETETTD
jgi:hypothetical protein